MNKRAGLRVVDGGRREDEDRPRGATPPPDLPPPIPIISPPTPTWIFALVGALLSLGAHGVLVVIAMQAPELLKAREEQIVQMLVVQAEPEPEPEPQAEPEPEPEPEREPEVVDYQDAMVTAQVAPQDTPQQQEAPPVFGVSMSSTVSAGSSWGISVGNTVAIKPEDSADVDVGGDAPVVTYQQIEREPVIIKRFEPEYPEEPKAAGIEGDVLLYLTIDGQGNVIEARVIRGPHPELNEAARQAMFQHKFRPATRGGIPVVVTNYPYYFTWIIEE